jgi:hypothetical protein
MIVLYLGKRSAVSKKEEMRILGALVRVKSWTKSSLFSWLITES